jgi:RNA polymerase sigma-70 factor (ECF subfamily)
MSSCLDRPAVAPGCGESFETVIVPHLDAGYRLARWLMRDEHDAEDVVQEASLRAFRYFRTFVGGDGRAWFLRIVRNTCYSWPRRGHEAQSDSFDEERHNSARPQSDPEALLLQSDDAALIARALSSLPDRFHRLLVLRELEGLSYRELSAVIGIPIGTVMSRLSRARVALRSALRFWSPRTVPARIEARVLAAYVSDSVSERRRHEQPGEATQRRVLARGGRRRTGRG